MADANDAPGAGDVTLTLPSNDGRSVTLVLKCTPRAFFRLSRRPGSIYGPGGVAALNVACHIDTMCEIIRTGVNEPEDKDPQLPYKVYAAGVLDVRDKLSTYLNHLGNGGRPPAPAPEPEGGAPLEE